MAYTPKVLYPSNTPATGGGVLYTVPTATSAIVKNIVMTNVTSSEAKITLSVVPSGGSPSTSNRILSEFAVPPNGISTLDMSLVMSAGSFLHGANQTSGAIVVAISGVEVA